MFGKKRIVEDFKINTMTILDIVYDADEELARNVADILKNVASVSINDTDVHIHDVVNEWLYDKNVELMEKLTEKN